MRDRSRRGEGGGGCGRSGPDQAKEESHRRGGRERRRVKGEGDAGKEEEGEGLSALVEAAPRRIDGERVRPACGRAPGGPSTFVACFVVRSRVFGGVLLLFPVRWGLA